MVMVGNTMNLLYARPVLIRLSNVSAFCRAIALAFLLATWWKQYVFDVNV